MFSYANNSIVFKGQKKLERLIECFGIFGVLALVVKLLILSWRKWCDPQIDYGRELYIPWRMAEGAKWLKDVDDLYGPLSRYIDAGLFKVFGPGIMVLAWANIILYFAILTLIYIIFRRTWGVLAALSAAFIFVGVFSFSQLTIISNYNFVTPYSQQATHGFLVSLVLVWLLPRWINASTFKLSFIVGLMVGLTAVLKPEFLLSGALLLIFAFIFHIKLNGKPPVKSLIAGFVGCILPSLLFFGIFSTYLPIKQAGFAACYAWLNGILIWDDQLTAHLLNSFSGMDQPKVHFISHALATWWALVVIGSIVVAGLSLRFIKLKGLQVGFGVFIALSVAAIGLKVVVWLSLGQSLLGLLSIYFVFRSYKTLTISKQGFDEQEVEKTLISVLALALMTRMVLNGRIFQYGFIQASLATIVIAAVLIDELPRLIKFKDRIFALYRLLIAVLLSCGVITIIEHSKTMQAAKTLPIGNSTDLFYTYPKTVSGDGEVIKYFTTTLCNDNLIKTFIVMPEGIMINYLTRKKSTVGTQAFYVPKLLELNLVHQLELKKPDGVVFITRDLSEYGVTSFGSKGQSGECLIDWLNKNYFITATFGVDPNVGKGAGGRIYRLVR